MVITTFVPRSHLFGAALSLACAGPAIAQPIDAACHMLWHVVELTPYLDQLVERVGGPQEAEALRAFDRALQPMPPTRVANLALSDDHLASRAPQLIAHVEALHALRHAAAQGNHATVRAGAHSPEMRAGAALVHQLLGEQGCRLSGWFAAGAGAASTQMPGAAIGDGTIEDPTIEDPTIEGGAAAPEHHAAVKAPRIANARAVTAAALLASALAALLWARALLRRRFELSRKHPRHGCGCWTTVEHGGEARKCLVIDASRRGCRITWPPRFRRGACVTIDVCGAPVSAKVMWRNEHFAGVRFAVALDDTQLAAFHQDPFGPAAAASDGGRNEGSNGGGARTSTA